MGLVAKDVDKTIEYLSSLGIRLFESVSGKSFRNRNIRGKPADHKLKIRVAQVGLVQMSYSSLLKETAFKRSF